MTEEVRSKEINSLPGTNITSVCTYSTLARVVLCDFCCSCVNPAGINVLAGFTEGLICLMHVGGFLGTYCRWCSVQSVVSNILAGILGKHVGLIFIFQADTGLGYICVPSTGVLVSSV
jgi:uncharacterized membrane protein (UPF0136 family)